MKVLYLISSILLGAVGQVFFKIGIVKIKSNNLQFFLDLFVNYWIYLGAASYGISFLLWMKVLKDYELGFARSLTSTGYILTYILAVLFLNEGFSWLRVAGILLITAGVFIITIK